VAWPTILRSWDLGPGSGILITAFVFAISHTQYFRLSVMSIGTLTAIVFSSILAGYVFYGTRSLLPVVIAHALMNVPLRTAAELAIAAGVLALVIEYREKAGDVRNSPSLDRGEL